MQIIVYAFVLRMEDEVPIFIFIDNTNGVALTFEPSSPLSLTVTSTTSLILEDISPIPLSTAHVLARRIPNAAARALAHSLIDSLASPSPIERAHSETIDALIDANNDSRFYPDPFDPPFPPGFDGGDGPAT